MILSDLAHRHLPKESFDRLRTAYFAMRKKSSAINLILHGSFTTEDLRKHLEAKIGDDFEILMVHSSTNALQPYYTGDPQELLKMLLDFCGPGRTLAMPAFYFGDPKIGSLNETLRQNPRFNMRRTPSQMGLLTELFRRTKGVRQSRHPAYRVSALGRLAEDLTFGHEFASSPAGLGSPFEFMAKRNTIVLGIGKSFEVMTQVHHVEEVMGDDFPVPRPPPEERQPLDVIFVEGKSEFPARLNRNGLLWRFNVMKLPSLLPKGQLKCWKFHGVPFFMAHAGEVTASLIEAAGQGRTLYDPR